VFLSTAFDESLASYEFMQY